jgi:hypothetical protein
MQRRFSPISVSPRYSKPFVEAGYAARDSPQILVEAMGLEPTNLLTASQALYQLSYAPSGGGHASKRDHTL